VTLNAPRPSIFKTEENTGQVELYLKDDELLALIDVVQFACRMYALAGNSLRNSGDGDKADQMDTKAAVAMALANMLIDDGDPGAASMADEVQ
jgi:hypothetical protein